MTKQSQLLRWVKGKGIFATHEIISFGNQVLFYNRADRTKRDFLEQGLIRKLSQEEKQRRGFTCKDGVYEFVVKEGKQLVMM